VGAFACGAPPPAEDAPPTLAALAPAIERCRARPRGAARRGAGRGVRACGGAVAGALTRSAWHGRCFGAQRASVGDITAALGAETGTDGAWAKGALAGMAAGAPLSRAATLAHYRAVARGLNPLDTVRLRRAPRAARGIVRRTMGRRR